MGGKFGKRFISIVLSCVLVISSQVTLFAMDEIKPVDEIELVDGIEAVDETGNVDEIEIIDEAEIADEISTVAETEESIVGADVADGGASEEQQENKNTPNVTYDCFLEEAMPTDVTGSSEEENILQSYIVDMKGFDDPYLKEQSAYYQWFHDAIGSPYAWANGIKGAGVKIGIISSGLNSHNDIDATRIKGNYSNYDGKESDFTDEIGYGTYFTGLLVGTLNNNKLGAGVCPDADIYNIKVDLLGSEGPKKIAEGIKQAVDAYDVDIIFVNYSIDTPDPDEYLEEAVDYAYSKGVAIFAPGAATGESYNVWPGAYDHVICVGSLDRNYMRAAESSYSSCIDIVAPGYYASSCLFNKPDEYMIFNGVPVAATIAAGEAALILSHKDNIEAFKNNGVLVAKNSQRVDILKKVMQSSTINVGSGTGKGMVYLPKALGLSSMTTNPAAPEITFGTITTIGPDYVIPVSIDSNDPDVSIIYTINGKNPSYKNGTKSEGSDYYSGTFNVNLADIRTDKLTVCALAYNSLGNISSVVKKQFDLTKLPQKIVVLADNDCVVKGKTLKLKADIIPYNSKTKNLEWHVSYAGNESWAKTNGVSISNGVVSTNNSTVLGDYRVWAVSKVDPSIISTKYNIKVVTKYVQSIAPKNKISPVYRDINDINMSYDDLYSLFDVTRTDGNVSTVSDVYFTSSNPSAVLIDSDMKMAKVKLPGKTKITAWAADGSGIKADVTFDVTQGAYGINYLGNGYDKVAAGKSLKLEKPVILPTNANVKKITLWSVDSAGAAAGVAVSNGKVTTKKTTPAGTYKITATVVNPNGSEISNTLDVTVIPDAVTKITGPKNVNLFRVDGAYGTGTQAEIKFNITGGERISGSPAEKGFMVKVDNENLAYLGGKSADTDGSITIGLVARGERTGKTKVTIMALDGSGAKASCVVNVTNPVSYIGIGPAKAGAPDFITAGGSLALKAAIGTGYGPVSNKSVKWSLTDTTYASITNKGVVKVKTDTPMGTKILVIAEAMDGSNAAGIREFEVKKNVGKISLYEDHPYMLGVYVPASKGEVEGLMYSKNLYVKVKASNDSIFGGFRLSSSNPKVGTIRYMGERMSVSGEPGYYYYKLYALGISKGTTKLTVMTGEGSQKVTYTLKVMK